LRQQQARNEREAACKPRKMREIRHRALGHGVAKLYD
jgi:hypothetical protein